MTPLALVRLFREKYSESLFFDFENEKGKKNNNRIGEELNKKKFMKKIEDEVIVESLF